MSRQVKAIQRLARSIAENGGIVGQALVRYVHGLLWKYAQMCEEITTAAEDCPEGDPDCDPIGNDHD